MLILLACPSMGACSTIDAPSQLLPSTTSPDFTLLVSNQSFAIDPVDIDVFIDGAPAVTGDFLVEGQHTWHEFTFDLAPGTHSVRAVSSEAGAEIERDVDIDASKFGVINFWFYPDDETERHFSFDAHKERPFFD